MLKRLLSALTGSTLVLVAVPVMAAAAPSTVTVTPTSNHGWQQPVPVSQYNGGTVNYVAANGAGALGSGAVEFFTPNDASYTRLRKDANQNVSAINNLSYITKQISAPASAANTAAVNLRLYIDTDGNGVFDDVLVYEPYYNAPVAPGWQTWNISQNAGFWWSNNNVTYNGHTTSGAGSYATNFHLSDVVTQFPSAKVVSIGLGTGDGNLLWKVQADKLTVNEVTYNFEQDKPVSPTDKDKCKDGGFKNFQTEYKNQGECVKAALALERSDRQTQRDARKDRETNRTESETQLTD